jgi:hypothetical protein
VAVAVARASASLVAHTITSPLYILARQWSDVRSIGSNCQKGIEAFPSGYGQEILLTDQKKTPSPVD